jgi:hypothetical protein
MRLTSILVIVGSTLLGTIGVLSAPSPALAQPQHPWNFCINKTIESTNRILAVKNYQGEKEEFQLPSSRQWFGIDLQITNTSNEARSGRDISLGNTTLVVRNGEGYSVSPEVSPIVHVGAINKPVNTGVGETVRLYFNLPAGSAMKGVSVVSSGKQYYIDYDRNPCSN